MNPKQLFERVAAPFAVPERLLALIAQTQQNLFLPFYHAVYDGKTPPPHLRHLYSVRSVREFERDIDTICRYFQPVGLDDILQQQKAARPFEQPVFHLSFDDGLRECADLIAPILQRKGVPATFFINSAFADNNALMFRYKASLLADALPLRKAEILSINYTNQNKQGNSLDEIAATQNIDFQLFLQQEKPYMNAATLRNMHQKGFTLGAHSHTHPLYSALPLAEQIRETELSLQYIQAITGSEHRVFSFPFTDNDVELAFFEAMQFDVSFGCAGVKLDAAPRHLQRTPMEHAHQNLAAEKFIALNYQYFKWLSAVGRERILRK